jgi:ubiquinone/menaquinone biosynthesis C-methylase UbiE
MLPKFADHRNSNSLASRTRAMRNAQFKSLLDRLPRPLNILDVGGTQMVWETIGLVDQPDVHITILNLEQEECRYKNVHSVVGDARDMRGFHDCQFDIVYSNSVIEHVGDMEQMVKMASEVRRVGRRYFVQTPNRYFPIEPHFVFPMFQFLPVSIRTIMVQKFSLGWTAKLPDRKRAEDLVRSINLLSRRELQLLFPDGRMMEERLLGLTKSFTIQKF